MKPDDNTLSYIFYTDIDTLTQNYIYCIRTIALGHKHARLINVQYTEHALVKVKK